MTNEFSRPVALAQLAEGPVTLDMAATEEERAGLARRFGLLTLERLSASVEMRGAGKDKVEIRGRLQARLAQPCVVTGDPVWADHREPVALLLADEATVERLEEEDAVPDTVDLDVLPEADALDLGEVVAQTLALALDPYPRRPDARLDAPDGVEVDRPSRSNPFEVLKGLKDT